MLACASPAMAQQSRIINGSAATQGEYPAHGFLELSTIQGNYICGGTLVSNRHFLTAAHCATEPETTTALAPGAFRVSLGQVNKSSFTTTDRYDVVQNQVHAGYALVGPDDNIPSNDVALLTLDDEVPKSLEPLRLIETGETALWADRDIATIIGWGRTGMGFPNALQEATVPMRSDAYCQGSGVWGTAFVPSTMVCAGGGNTDTCGGDSGGPLMVSDGAFLVLAGLTSWGANQCATEDVPGVYTRLGAAALNAWVRDRVPMARAAVSDATVDPGETVTFSVNANHPGVAGYFTNFSWDFGDGTPAAAGASVTHTYADGGRYVARVLAVGAGDDTATDKVAVQVGEASPEPTPTATPTVTPQPTVEPTPEPTGAPQPSVGPQPAPPLPAARPAVSGPLATILAARRPKVGDGRFGIRVRFARSAPAGTAVVEVIRTRRVIGIARARVLRGGTKRIRVKLTPSGRRQLVRSRSGRLTFKVRVRVGRRVLRSKTVTVRR